jgi:regulator of extracellular matrix RemA (YlzA/DUF370 family)
MSPDYLELPEEEPKKFISTGYKTFVQANLVLGGSPPDSSPIKNLRREATQKSHLVNYTEGHKTRTVLKMVNGDIVLSASEPDTILRRLNGIRRRKRTKGRDVEDLPHAKDPLSDWPLFFQIGFVSGRTHGHEFIGLRKDQYGLRDIVQVQSVRGLPPIGALVSFLESDLLDLYRFSLVLDLIFEHTRFNAAGLELLFRFWHGHHLDYLEKYVWLFNFYHSGFRNVYDKLENIFQTAELWWADCDNEYEN